mgnify:CR=1 FL=1
MRLSIFSDLHGDTSALERIIGVECEYYFCLGDLSTFGRGMDRMGPILKKKADRVYVVPGNHESEAENAKFCETYGLHNFHGKTIGVAGYYLCGLGYSNITPFNTPGEFTEDQFDEKLKPWAARRPLILMCHCPPLDTALDRAGEGKHFGSLSIRKFIDTTQPEYFFCGHIHEAEGASTMIGRTKSFNVGRRGFVLDL